MRHLPGASTGQSGRDIRSPAHKHPGVSPLATTECDSCRERPHRTALSHRVVFPPLLRAYTRVLFLLQTAGEREEQDHIV